MTESLNFAASDKQAPSCPICGLGKMKADDKWVCINDCGKTVVKTGQTVVLSEPKGKDGPVKIERVIQAGQEAAVPQTTKAVAPEFTPEQIEQEIQRRTNTVLLHVPTSLFPDLVMWARKLKLPKDWKEAEKIKAITDFQVEINKKLEGLSR